MIRTVLRCARASASSEMTAFLLGRGWTALIASTWSQNVGTGLTVSKTVPDIVSCGVQATGQAAPNP